jgi:hypothetical protein
VIELECEMPEAVPRPPRRDDTAADTESLVRLGRQDPPPTPTDHRPHPVPTPAPDPVDTQEAVSLSAALTEAGVTQTADDQAAVQALAGLDAATVAAVERWLKTKKPKDQTPAK